MKLSISKKFAKRSIKCLALFAPLAYLFGSLFFGLNGAHGQPLFADSISQYSADFNVPVRGIVIGPTGIQSGDNTFATSTYQPVYGGYPMTYTVNAKMGSLSLSFYDADKVWIERPVVDQQSLSERVVVGTYDVPSNASYVRLMISVGSSDMVFNSASFYETFPQDELNRYTYNDYLFKQFFAKDNFLVQWGRNAISDNPVGFAPFGSFFKLLDDNIFHLSDSQIGLMAYGYLYYCLHVLIACLAFDIVAFIPLFVQRVQDRLGGKEDD